MANKIYKLNFSIEKVNSIRNAIKEREVLSIQKENEVYVKVNKKNSDKRIFKSWDRIWACVNRIEDTLDYLNGIELGRLKSKRSAFDFFEFINNEYIVIECIKTLAKIFNVSTEKIKEVEISSEVFNNVGDGSGNDSEFFEYIRSLIAVHPVNTSRHPAYHGYGKFHCSPFVVWQRNALRNDNRDLSVFIYKSEDGNSTETIPLRVEEFIKYLNKWIGFMDIIIEDINNYNIRLVEEYRKNRIKGEDEFENYIDYIENLKIEYCKRYDNFYDYILDYFIKVFKTDISNNSNIDKYNKYKNAIKYSLKFLHNRLQEMNNDEFSNTGIIYPQDNLETELFIELYKSYCLESDVCKYRYNIEKLIYLGNEYDYYDKIYARDLLEEMKDWINKYVKFTNQESDEETVILIKMALYFDSLKYSSLLNRNIPNEIKYRENILTRDEWDKLFIKKEK